MQQLQQADDQQVDFRLPNGSVIRAWVDDDGKLRLIATSNGTKLSIEPLTGNSLAVVAQKRR